MKHILGLDLGNKNFRFVLGGQDKNFKPKILAVSEFPSSGLSKGSILDLDEFISKLKSATDELKEFSGRIPKSISITVAGPHMAIKEGRGIIPISRADGEVSSFDIDTVIRKSQEINLGQNKSVLHVIPREYSVDDLQKIKDPLGMHGIKLEVDSLIIAGFIPNLKTTTKAFDELGMRVEDKIFKPLAAARSSVSRKQEEVGTVLVDLGGDSVSFVIFEEGRILSLGSFPIGSNHITHDIAICLKTSLDVAEKIKLHYGSAISSEVQRKDVFDLSKISPELEGEISKKYLSEIIEARLEEIFGFIMAELKKIDRFGKLPGGVVLVGSGAKMPRLVNFVKNYLRLPARIGRPINLEEDSVPEEILEIIDDPSYASAVGTFLLAIDNLNADVSHSPSPFLSKIRKIGRMFLP